MVHSYKSNWDCILYHPFQWIYLWIKVVCVFPMVVTSMLLHAEFGPNGHREDAPHFRSSVRLFKKSSIKSQSLISSIFAFIICSSLFFHRLLIMLKLVCYDFTITIINYSRKRRWTDSLGASVKAVHWSTPSTVQGRPAMISW